jgi:hypothetical protein
MTHTTISSGLSTAKVRLSDSAVLAGSVSLLYALALVLFPQALPEFLQSVYDQGYLFPALGVLLLVANEILFAVICRRRAQKANWFTSCYLAFLTIAAVVGFRQLVAAAELQSEILHLVTPGLSRVREGVSSEELLVYTFLATVSSIFLPYLLVRVTQSYVAGTKPKGDTQVQQAAAGH